VAALFDGMSLEMVGVTIGVAAVVYLIPTFVSSIRHHRQSGPIAVVNIFLGWTLVGWVVALAWSVSGSATPARPKYNRR